MNNIRLSGSESLSVLKDEAVLCQIPAAILRGDRQEKEWRLRDIQRAAVQVQEEHSNNHMNGSSGYEFWECAGELFLSKAAGLSFSTFFFYFEWS